MGLGLGYRYIQTQQSGSFRYQSKPISMRRQRMDLKPDLFTPRRPSAPADSMKLLSLIFTIGFQDPTLHYLEWSWPGEKDFNSFPLLVSYSLVNQAKTQAYHGADPHLFLVPCFRGVTQP